MGVKHERLAGVCVYKSRCMPSWTCLNVCESHWKSDSPMPVFSVPTSQHHIPSETKAAVVSWIFLCRPAFVLFSHSHVIGLGLRAGLSPSLIWCAGCCSVPKQRGSYGRWFGQIPSHGIWNPELWLAITVKVNDLDLHAFFSMLLHSSWIGNKNRQVAQWITQVN